MFPVQDSDHHRILAEVIEGAATRQDLINNHPKRITIRLLGGCAVLPKQQFGTRPTDRPHRGNGSCGERDRVEVDRNCCEAKVRNEGDTVVVDEEEEQLSFRISVFIFRAEVTFPNVFTAVEKRRKPVKFGPKKPLVWTEFEKRELDQSETELLKETLFTSVRSHPEYLRLKDL